MGPRPLLDSRTLFRQAIATDMKNVREIQHNTITYAYPDGSIDVICAADPIFREPGWEAAGWDEKPKAKGRQAGKKSEGDDMLRSMRRARAKLRRLALANSFEYFVTLTLAPDRIDRYDGAAIVKALGQWADNMVRRHGLRYILVPERHKDGAFHFHGFFAGEGVKYVDSGHRDSVGDPVYNLPQWTLGFSTAIRLRGEYHAAVGYCCKYIGKQEGQRPLGRWYYSGGALCVPLKEYHDLDFRACGENSENCAEFNIPGTKIKVLRLKGGKNDD